ncbi:uncharacterized protein LOC126968432 [Leptidea sinapis]|uniref:uncharacterized protein LOC126968432 n=1 Tax=Leptidea sinapis TaxID=189913 RepID=UPI002140DCC8|nr:uncharacterized protein LOC126968432 [Leptidea sinapis]
MYNNSVVPVKNETFSAVAAKSPIGQCIKTMLRRACAEKRLTIGLMPTLQFLSKNINGALFCIQAEARPGDSATHMQEVLLQAFCMENDIYSIKVDSEEKLKKLLGCGKTPLDFTCLLVHYPCDPFADCQPIGQSILSPSERDLIDYCDNNLVYSSIPVIKLPEK